MRQIVTVIVLTAAALAGCGSVDYKHAPLGKFEGSVLVLWVGENRTRSGDGKFVYVPSRTPLRFERTAADATLRVIQPGPMYTDGGSIPRAAQMFKGFSPWGYGPAYVVHDWLFYAHRCGQDNPGDASLAGYRDMTFAESADVMAEAIRTLVDAGKVKKDDLAGSTISSVVAGPISAGHWNARGRCADEQITAEDQAEIDRALGGPRALRAGDGPTARIVTEITF